MAKTPKHQHNRSAKSRRAPKHRVGRDEIVSDPQAYLYESIAYYSPLPSYTTTLYENTYIYGRNGLNKGKKGRRATPNKKLHRGGKQNRLARQGRRPQYRGGKQNRLASQGKQPHYHGGKQAFRKSNNRIAEDDLDRVSDPQAYFYESIAYYNPLPSYTTTLYENTYIFGRNGLNKGKKGRQATPNKKLHRGGKQNRLASQGKQPHFHGGKQNRVAKQGRSPHTRGGKKAFRRSNNRQANDYFDRVSDPQYYFYGSYSYSSPSFGSYSFSSPSYTSFYDSTYYFGRNGLDRGKKGRRAGPNKNLRRTGKANRNLQPRRRHHPTGSSGRVRRPVDRDYIRSEPQQYFYESVATYHYPAPITYETHYENTYLYGRSGDKQSKQGRRRGNPNKKLRRRLANQNRLASQQPSHYIDGSGNRKALKHRLARDGNEHETVGQPRDFFYDSVTSYIDPMPPNIHHVHPLSSPFINPFSTTYEVQYENTYIMGRNGLYPTKRPKPTRPSRRPRINSGEDETIPIGTLAIKHLLY